MGLPYNDGLVDFANGPFGQPATCSECGDDSPAVDEATELCEMCFEHTCGVND